MLISPHIRKILNFQFWNICSKSRRRKTFLCYYFHTKGASHSKDTLKWYTRRGVRTLDELRGNSGAWRRMMEYWIFDKYKLAISCLMKGYMAYGAMIYDVNDTLRYFGGNFWWSTSEFIRTREKISGLDRADRYKAEGWLLKGPNISYYCPFYCSVDLTGAEIPVECYDSGFYGRRTSPCLPLSAGIL